VSDPQQRHRQPDRSTLRDGGRNVTSSVGHQAPGDALPSAGSPMAGTNSPEPAGRRADGQGKGHGTGSRGAVLKSRRAETQDPRSGRKTARQQPRRLYLRPRHLPTVLIVLLAVAAVTMRIYLVKSGIMYGATPVTEASWVTGALVLLAAIMIYRTLTEASSRRTPTSDQRHSDHPGAPGKADTAEPAEPAPETPLWGDNAVRLVTVATAIGTFVAGVTAIVNVWAPKDPPGLPVASCPGARVWKTPYIGTNTPSQGVNGRLGPARSYPPDRRLAGNCTVGYSAYCLGDPINDPTGTTEHARWVDTRWLLIAKNPKGPAGALAHWLSGEPSQPQFVSESLVAPQRPYDDAKPAPTGQCPGNYPAPRPATLAPLQMTGIYATLTATSTHAANIGFAVWKPTDQPFLDPNSYLQIYNPDRPPDDNPGATDASGSKTVVWPFRSALVTNLKPSTRPNTPVTADVVVFAIPCLSDNVPADRTNAALAAYTISSDGTVTPARDHAVLNRPDLSRDQLARTACEAIV
jgi:hypothetical protein